MSEDLIYIVTSRDRGFVNAFKKLEDAEQSVKDQTFSEEMSGGRPSVWYKVVELQ